MVLDGLGVDYDTWDVSIASDPSTADLSGYRKVLWFTGYPWTGSFIGTNESAVAAYLDGGGSFFLSSQDYLFEMNLTSFGQNYLHISSYDDDVNHSTVTGQNVFSGLGPYSLAYPFTNYSDIVNPDTQAQVAFIGNVFPYNTAISFNGSNFNTVFLGFPLEAVPQAGRQAIMERTLEFLGSCELTPPVIVVSPAAISMTLEEGQSDTTALLVENQGGSVLTYTISTSAAWLSAEPLSGSVAPLSSQDITLTLDATSLSVDVYTTTLEVNSNDPVQPLLSVPVTLTVVPACDPLSGVDFTWTPLDPEVGTVITFTATASGTQPITFLWNFGDGITATSTIVTHAYDTSGTYTVTLTASNPCDLAIMTHPIPITYTWQLFLPVVSKQ